MNNFYEQIKIDEGLRLKPYRCSAGKLTIGVGRNIEENGISEEEAIHLLKNDIERSDREVDSVFTDSQIKSLSNQRKEVLVNMMFNLGKKKFLKFKKMIDAIQFKNWGRAADEMLDSKWAAQVGRRALRLANIMRTGYE
ncbi:MAG: glycoside hydrolase family protein [Flavobacteriales bacterium]|nr:glycoside hydrolase family protein [Flavobacteriales bacterium]